MNLTQTGELLSLSTAIPPGEEAVRDAFVQLASLAAPPHGAPCSYAAARGMRICIENAIKTLNSPNTKAQEILESFSLLEAQLKSLLEANGRTELLCALDGTKTRNSEWHFFVSAGSSRNVHCLATVYVGLKSLMAIHMLISRTN